MTIQTPRQKPATHRTVPVAGMGATLVYPTDRYPMRIARVSPTGHAIWVLPVSRDLHAQGVRPAYSCNGYPVWDHEYSDAELDALTHTDAALTKATRRHDGTYRLTGGQTQIAVGQAQYFRNFAD